MEADTHTEHLVHQLTVWAVYGLQRYIEHPRSPTTMTDTELTALLMLTTAASFTPGPNTTLSTALAANRGLRGALHFVCAVPVGWGALFVLCAAGVGAMVVAVPLLRWGIQGCGLVYLLWLASRLARRPVPNTLNPDNASALQTTSDLARPNKRQARDTDGTGPNVTFWQGVALQFLNIKAWMLALAVVAGWIAGRADATERTFQILPLMVAFGFVSNLLYAMVGSLLRHWLAGPVVHGVATGNRLLAFNRIMAGVLVLTAAWMGASALGLSNKGVAT